MRFAARDPDVHVGSGVGIAAYKAHDGGFVIEGVEQAIHHGAKFEWDYVDIHAQLAKVVLNDCGHLGALRIRRACEDGKFHRGAARVNQGAIVFPGKAGRLQELARVVKRACRTRKRVVHPQLVSGCDLTPQRSCAAVVHEANDSGAIHGGGNGLAEANVLKPELFPGNFRQAFGSEIVQIEEEKIVFETGAEIMEAIAFCRLLFFEDGKILRAETAENVGVPGLKTDHLRVFAGNNQEVKLVEIGEPASGTIFLPVIRVLLKDDSLAKNIFFHAESAETSEVIGRRGKIPDLREVSFTIRVLEKMARKNCQAVKKPFGCGVWLRQFETNRIVIHFFDRDGFSPDNQEGALRGMDFFIEVALKCEDDVVRRERLAIGEAKAVAKMESVLFAVARDIPRLRELRFGL